MGKTGRLCCLACGCWLPMLWSAETPYAEIRVLDADTKRGVPLVELETVNGLVFVTDNAGRVAFHEPGLMNRELYFHVRSHGYAIAPDGFGFAGVKITPRVGEVAEIKIKRHMPAERLCRLTGEGLYRDSLLLGHVSPLPVAKHPGNVSGQDSVQTALYRGQIYWFWGDTMRMEYPLGLFRMAGATTPLFAEQSDPSAGIPFDYFVNAETGFARAMMPLAERPTGVVWLSALAVLKNAEGREHLVGHYSRREGLKTELEQGVAIYDDASETFQVLQQLPLTETWRKPSGHPITITEDGKTWLLFGSPTPNVRVPATLEAVPDPAQYEAYTCLPLSEAGKPVWRWQKQQPPLDSATEQQLVKSGKIRSEQARFCPANAAKREQRIVLHNGSVRWNTHRQKWILLAGQLGGDSSFLGEVWYSEAEHPTGPFSTAVKVLTHNQQTFYNVCQHAFLDRQDGRFIHFEGTYTQEFSNNPWKTPRYNYNQILYRLDLDNPALAAATKSSQGDRRPE